MTPVKFDSFVESPLGTFVESPLGVRETEVEALAGYIINGTQINWRYSMSADSWSTRQPDEAGGAGQSACFAMTTPRVAIRSGRAPLDQDRTLGTTTEYNPVSNSWSRRQDLNHEREQHSAAGFDNKGFVFGGIARLLIGGGDMPAGQVTEEYAPDVDSWTYRTDKPGLFVYRYGAATEVLANGLEAVYVTGGQRWGPLAGESINTGTDHIRLNTNNYNWWTREDVPVDCARHFATSTSLHQYVVGGWTRWGRPLSERDLRRDCHRYTSESNSWQRQTSYPIQTYSSGGFVLDDVVFSAGGWAGPYNYPDELGDLTDRMWKFTDGAWTARQPILWPTTWTANSGVVL